MTLHDQIAEYAAVMAGTDVDLDEELEAAGCSAICDSTHHMEPPSLDEER